MLLNKINRLMIMLLILLISVASVNAEDTVTVTLVRSDSFTIQAGYDEVCEIDIKAIPAQSMAYIAGMPFDIEDDIVAYSAPDAGRRIATFSILSNTPFEISFSGEPMRYMQENSTETYSDEYRALDYILYFDCELGLYQNGVLSPASSETFSYRSSGEDGQKWRPSISMDDNSYVGNVEGAIRFMFDEATTNFIRSADDNTLPPGNYGSEVKVTITPIETQGGAV